MISVNMDLIPEELKEDINQDCPLSTRFALDLYLGDRSKLPHIDSNDPEYVQKIYLSWLENRDEINALHCDMDSFEQKLSLGLHAIAWVMISKHIRHNVSIFDIYQAMCDFERKQREFLKINLYGFLEEGEEV